MFSRNSEIVVETGWQYKRVRVWALACLAIALVILLLTGAFAFSEWREYGVSRANVVRTRSAMTAASELMSALQDAETGQRGYLLTGDTRYLQPYENAVRTVSHIEQNLLELLASSPSESARAETVRRFVPGKMSELAKTIALRQSGDDKGALAEMRTDRGKEAMDRLRVAIDGIQAAESAALDLQMQTVRRRANRARVIAIAGSAVMFVFLCAAALIVVHAENDRDRFVEALSGSNDRTHAARDLLQITLSSIGDAVIATDTDGRVSFMNQVAEALTGWTWAEASGVPLEKVFVIVDEEHRNPAVNPVLRALRDGVVQELANHTVLIDKNGESRPIDDSAAPIRDRKKEIVGAVLVFRDITARHESERRIRESEAFARGILESSADPTLVLDTQGRIMPRRYGEAHRAEPAGLASLVGQNWRDLWGQDRQEEAETVFRVAASGRIGRMQGYSAALDGIAKWWDVTVSPVIAENGEPAAFVSTARDIAAMKEAEAKLEAAYAREFAAREEAESARRQVARQASELARSNTDLERFAFAASHDLQEPLRTIVAYTQLFLRRNERHLDADGAVYLKFVTDAAKRMSILIRDLLAYSQVLKAVPDADESVNIDNVLDQVISNCAVLIGESGAVVHREPMPVIPGRESHLVQIFQNLITNAIRYRRPEVMPEITVSATDRGREWLFEVRDNGSGIERRYQSQVFDMFRRFSTGGRSGTGLGLALCQKIVESRGGTIGVESEAGVGSRFFFSWPTKSPDSGANGPAGA